MVRPDPNGEVPDLSNYSLSFLESPGTDYICAIFWSFSDDGTQLPTRYLYLYESHVREADFSCDPYFAPTRDASIAYDSDLERWVLSVYFNAGHLKIAFDGFSTHVITRKVESA